MPPNNHTRLLERRVALLVHSVNVGQEELVQLHRDAEDLRLPSCLDSPSLFPAVGSRTRVKESNHKNQTNQSIHKAAGGREIFATAEAMPSSAAAPSLFILPPPCLSSPPSPLLPRFLVSLSSQL
jgi:hypothetical protein